VSPSVAGWASVVGGYLLGSIPFGLVLARRVAGIDVRDTGSGNIGATNVARSAGRGLGLATLLLDAGKGAVAVWAAAALTGEARGGGWPAAAGLAAFLGHVFPPWLRFRGGKGVATGFGIFLALSPVAALAATVAFGAAFAASGMASVGSLTAALTCAVAAAWADGPGSPVARVALVVLAVVVLRHHDNLRRILRGEERSFRRSGRR
jgi:acyl phosphate:glycerol-3-phosphate acyltransferase